MPCDRCRAALATAAGTPGATTLVQRAFCGLVGDKNRCRYFGNTDLKETLASGRLDQRGSRIAGEGALAGDLEDAVADVSVFAEVRGGRVIGVNSAIDGVALGEVGVELRAELAITAGTGVSVLDLTVIGVHGLPGGWDAIWRSQYSVGGR